MAATVYVNLKVVCGRNLKAADINGKSDPYVVITNKAMPNYKWKSAKKSSTLNPDWNETVPQLTLPLYTELKFEVFDYDTIGAHDSLGKAKLPIVRLLRFFSDLSHIRSQRIAVANQPPRLINLALAKGYLTVEISVQGPPGPIDPYAAAYGQQYHVVTQSPIVGHDQENFLEIAILEARGLRPRIVCGNVAVEIKNVSGLTMGDLPHSTRVLAASQTGDVVFSEGFHYPFSHKLSEIVFTVVDKGANTAIGGIKFFATELFDQNEHTLVLKLTNQGSPAGDLIVKVRAVFGFPLLALGQSAVITSPFAAVGLGWDAIRAIDLDVSLIQLDSDLNRLDYINFAKQTATGMQHGGDNRTGEGNGDDEEVRISLSAMGPKVEYVAVLVCSYGNVPFSALSSFYFRVRQVGNLTSSSAGAKLTLAYARWDSLPDQSALCIGFFYRFRSGGGGWRFTYAPQYEKINSTTVTDHNAFPTVAKSIQHYKPHLPQ